MKKVNYRVSLYPSKYMAYNRKNKDEGEVTLYISNIYDETKSFTYFWLTCVFITILERICLERGFNRVRMKSRCRPHCKLEKYAMEMFRGAFL